MAYAVSITSPAAKDIRALDEPTKRRVVKAIDALSADPRSEGVRKLKATEDIYRIRVGIYRILYQIEDRRLVVLVVRVRHRKDVYR